MVLIFHKNCKIMDFVFSDFQNQRPAMAQRLLLQLLLLCCAIEVFGSSLLNRHLGHLKRFRQIVPQFVESYSLWNQKAIFLILSMLMLWVYRWFQSFPHSQFLFNADSTTTTGLESLHQANLGRRRPRRPGFSNSFFQFWESCRVFKKFAL